MPRCGLPGQLSLQAPVASAPPVSPRPYPASPGPFPAFPRRAPLWPAPSGTCPFAPDLLGGALRLLCLAGILRPVRFILLPHAVRGTAFPSVLLKLAAFGLRAIVARRTVLPGILVLKPQASGQCGGRSFPFSRSGAIAPGILRLRRPRPLKIPFVRFLSDDVSLLSKPRAIMARSVLCPVHFLFLSSGRVVIMAYSSVFCGKRSTNGMVVFPKNSSPSPELVWVT